MTVEIALHVFSGENMPPTCDSNESKLLLFARGMTAFFRMARTRHQTNKWGVHFIYEGGTPPIRLLTIGVFNKPPFGSLQVWRTVGTCSNPPLI